MKTEPVIATFSYLSFRRELHTLLETHGIRSNRLPIMAGISQNRKWDRLTDKSIKQKVGEVIIYMNEHLSEELSLEELAKEIDLSKYQLIRGFHKEEGTTPWKFLITKRIEKVKEMLEEGVPPGHAAVEAGFFDQSHLCRIFREEMDMTPKEYQEKNFKNKN